jgi:hypothetical protein
MAAFSRLLNKFPAQHTAPRLAIRISNPRQFSQLLFGGMAGTSNKKQKREDYRAAQRQDGVTELPKKKFYRQRAHANPFSDHQLL